MAEQHPTSYGIVLESSGFSDEIYGYSFTDPELVRWLEEPVVFPPGMTSLRIAVPGYEDRTVGVTIGSAANDKLLGLVSVDAGRPHRALTRTEAWKHEAIYDELEALCGDRVYTGGIY